MDWWRKKTRDGKNASLRETNTARLSDHYHPFKQTLPSPQQEKLLPHSIQATIDSTKLIEPILEQMSLISNLDAISWDKVFVYAMEFISMSSFSVSFGVEKE